MHSHVHQPSNHVAHPKLPVPAPCQYSVSAPPRGNSDLHLYHYDLVLPPAERGTDASQRGMSPSAQTRGLGVALGVVYATVSAVCSFNSRADFHICQFTHQSMDPLGVSSS